MNRPTRTARARRRTAAGAMLAIMSAAAGLVTVAPSTAAEAAAPRGRASSTLSAAKAHAGARQSSMTVGRGQVTIESGRPSATITAPAGRVTVALEGATGAAEASDGLVGFADVAPATGAAIRSGDGWVQLLAVMHGPDASPVQRYRLDLPPGSQLTPAAHGGFVIRSASGAVVGDVAAPWARDATGRELPTTYTLHGTTIVQRTDTTGAVFPVVADPRLTYGWGVYLNMTGAEMRAAAIAIIAIGGGAAAVGCTLVSRLPHPILITIGMLICAAGVNNITKVWDAIVHVYRSTAVDDSACYQMKIVPMGSGFTKVSRSNCG